MLRNMFKRSMIISLKVRNSLMTMKIRLNRFQKKRKKPINMNIGKQDKSEIVKYEKKKKKKMPKRKI